MSNTDDYKEFQKLLNDQATEHTASESEAAEAYRNLGEFFVVLAEINAREHIVSVGNPAEK